MNRKYTEDQLKTALLNSTSFRQILGKLGLKEAGGNYKTVQNHIKKLQLDTNHLTGKGWLKGKRNPHAKPAKNIDELLVDGIYYQTFKLKKRLIQCGLLEQKCYAPDCTITTHWNSKPIQLRLDHINGKNDDNRLENLRLLCPNCDSQTETYCGKNKRKV